MKTEKLTPLQQRAAAALAAEWENLERDQASTEAIMARRAAVRVASPQNVIKLPPSPGRPPELDGLLARRAEFRDERHVIERDLAQLQARLSDESQSDEDTMDRAATRLAEGEVDVTSQSVLPEQIQTKRARLDLVIRADQKLSRRIADLNAAHNRQTARTLRPQHRAAVQRIHRALLELEAANIAEQEVRTAIPGAPMDRCNFPNIGTRSPGTNTPIIQWITHARRLGFLNEDEQFPAAAF
jgi:hypothetical protein